MTGKEYKSLKVGDKIEVYQSENDRCDSFYNSGDIPAVITDFERAGGLIWFRLPNGTGCFDRYDSTRDDGRPVFNITNLRKESKMITFLAGLVLGFLLGWIVGSS